MDGSKIEWTDATWNPIRGCSRVSEGCRFCYAERVAARFSGEIIAEDSEGKFMKPLAYRGLAKMTADGPRWTGEVRFVKEKLEDPLRWKRPRRIFVNSMSDLFHEKAKSEWIDSVFAAMGLAHWHTFQVLTKRPERALAYFQSNPYDRILRQAEHLLHTAIVSRAEKRHGVHGISDPNRIPWRHVWLGVSVEDQATADERIPFLLQTPAAVRWVSYEPALGPVNFASYMRRPVGLDQIIVGGESGPGARPFDIVWARKVVAQCREAGVKVFVKQLGARPYIGGDPQEGIENGYKTASKKGGDPAEWPADLRVREYP